VTNTKYVIVVPWHREEEIQEFMEAWGISTVPDWLILQHDEHREGCAVTKNRGIARALVRGADVVVILDGDCYPGDELRSLQGLAEWHIDALRPQEVEMFQAVTYPPSRGTPYMKRTMEMPVAASMGFWEENGDHCAVRQLATNNEPMRFSQGTIFGKYFPLCGMNLAFRPADWDPWCRFIEVERFDDIWQGWLWQKKAYAEGYCFNLNGPRIRHSRQSHVWGNLRAEVKHLEKNETLWIEIAKYPSLEYEELRRLLPV